nr:hypothetical protein [uncultured Draconibacterium sp.]
MGRWYKELDKKFSWSFFGFFVGVLGLLFGFYAFYHKEKPKLQFEIVTNTDVFNLHENIGKLQILYDNENVLSIDTTLKLVTVKLINSGGASIKKDDFDKDYLLKLNIENYIIADKPSVIDYSNTYLKERLQFTYNSKSIIINPIILDKDDYVIFKLLIIGARNEEVKMISTGKIAGQKNIPVLTDNMNKEKKPIWYYPSIIIGAFISLLFMGFILALVEELANHLSLKKKNKVINRFKENLKIKSDKYYDEIFKIYRENGLEILSFIIDLSNNSEKFEKFLATNVNSKFLTYQDLKYIGIKVDSKLKLSDEFNKKSFMDELLLKDNFVERENGKPKFKDEFIQNIENLIKFIKK